jgi:hypothetical protein
MGDNESKMLRQLLVDAMSGHHAHIDFESALEDFPASIRGLKPAGGPHTPWQLLEHIRIAQWDILEFSRNPKHKSPKWPSGYWPKTEAPPNAEAWDESIKAFLKDAKELNTLIRDTHHDLFKRFEHGTGQTLAREAIVLANHTSYHLGQLVYLKKALLEQS